MRCRIQGNVHARVVYAWLLNVQVPALALSEFKQRVTLFERHSRENRTHFQVLCNSSIVRCPIRSGITYQSVWFTHNS
jgi:hypothetical protein